MIKHIWSVLCLKALIDSDTNNLTIVDVLEELSINVSSAPVANAGVNTGMNRIDIPITYEVVSLWIRDSAKTKETVTLKVEVIDPSGKELNMFEQPAEMKEGLLRYRTRLKISGMEVTTPGRYTFHVKIKEEGKENYRSV